MFFQTPQMTPGTLVHERYRIVKVVGQGGMGVVYEAEDERLMKRIALKQTLVSGEGLERAFEREARLLASLFHRGLPRVSDYFIIDQSQFLVMDYIDGPNLEELANQQTSPFTIKQVLTWAYQLCDILVYLHNKQPPIIHRDIKPQNLKLSEDHHIMLLDFGLAKNSDQDLSKLTGTRSLFGYTPNYSPPEQINGSRTDVRSDVYALAATLYFLLAGVPPSSAMTRISAFTNDEPDPLKPLYALRGDLPQDVSNVISTAMLLKSANRYPSVAALRDALHGAEMGVPQTMPNITIAQQISEPDLTAYTPPIQSIPSNAAPPPQASNRPDTTDLFDPNDADATRIHTGPQPTPQAVSQPAPPPVPQTARKLPIVWVAAAGLLVLILGAVALFASGGFNQPEQVGSSATITPLPPSPQAIGASDAQTAVASSTATSTPTRIATSTLAPSVMPTINFQATAQSFSASRVQINSQESERVAQQLELPNASARYDRESEMLLLQAYSNSVTGAVGQRGLRTNAQSRDGSLWIRDVDYTISGYGYSLADLSVFRETLELFLKRVDPDGEVAETIITSQGSKTNTGAWDSMPNLIHGVYFYVSKTGDRAFYQRHRDTLQRVGDWIAVLDNDGDGLPEHNDKFIYGYYNSVSNSVRHTYALAKFYRAYNELAELERSIGGTGLAWYERAVLMREAYHAPSSPYWGQKAWPVAWLRPDGTPVETLETFGVFEAIDSGLIGPQDGARYTRLTQALHQEFGQLTANGAPMRLALGGYPQNVLRTTPRVPAWMLDVSASWIVGRAAPVYAAAGYPEDARTLIELYRQRAGEGTVHQFVAGPSAAFGPGKSNETNLPWDSSAWFMAVYSGHYGLRYTPNALVIAPSPFRTLADDGVELLSYQGAIINLSLDSKAASYQISVDRPTAVRLYPMAGYSSLRLDDAEPQAMIEIILEPNRSYTIQSIP
jgi:serine/threonine protein kinase